MLPRKLCDFLNCAPGITWHDLRGVFMFHTGIAGELMGRSNSNPESRPTGTLRLCSLLLVMVGTTSSLIAQSTSGAAAQLNINVTRIISPVSPTLYGLMTEEINHSYDGGLYAEMIQNRAF